MFTTQTISPSEKCQAKNGIADIEDDAEGCQKIDNFVGNTIDPNDRHGESEKCESLQTRENLD